LGLSGERLIASITESIEYLTSISSSLYRAVDCLAKNLEIVAFPVRVNFVLNLIYFL
jgi:hypothetical protein